MSKPSPNHVAIIMDGNGRWAKKKNLPNIMGYRTGAQVASKIIDHAAHRGIGYLTLFAFSNDNWARGERWTKDFMDLLRQFLLSDTQKFIDQGVRLSFIGSREGLGDDIVKKMEMIEEKSIQNNAIHVLIALNYSGRDEMTRCFKRMVNDAKHGHLSIDDLTQEDISSYLDTKSIPDPDLLIRTSAEQRLSNFMLWQLAYSEFVFSSVLWPDFTINDFDSAIDTYCLRDRRYGA
jgi:undecaprenyl diphosphate synthase